MRYSLLLCAVMPLMQCSHVIVVGGGLAGLSAAVEALNHGANVTLLDGEGAVGGNSAKASSGINGCDTPVQRQMNIKVTDGHDIFFGDTMSAGDSLNDAGLVDVLVHKANHAVTFLTEAGVPLTDVNLCGGHSVPRTHWLTSPKEGKPLPVGVAIIRALKAKLDRMKEQLTASNKDQWLQIHTGVLVRDVLYKDGRVSGVTQQSHTGAVSDVQADAVVLATGGFSSDHLDDSLLQEFAPSKTKLPTTNGAFAKGLGVKMARRIGAKLVHMGHVQVHPTAFIDPNDPSANTKFLAAEALRGKGALLLNAQGQRFANELGRRDYLTQQIQDQCSEDAAAKAPVAWMLMNEQAVQAFGLPAFTFYWKIKKFFTKAETVAEVIELTGFDESAFEQSILDYNQAAQQGAGAKDMFGKQVFPTEYSTSQGPFYLAQVTPALHYTMGGLGIDTDARVLHTDNRVIEGLYAAGEVTGGLHGTNRLAGNSLLECVVFGRIAGLNAAAHNQ